MQNKFYSERHYQRRSFAPYVYNVHAWGCSWILSAVCYVWHRTLLLSICKPDLSVHHWNGNVFILMKFSSLAAPKVVKMTTFSAASDENFVKMMTFPFQCGALCPAPVMSLTGWYIYFSGHRFNIKTIFPGVEILIIKMSRSWDSFCNIIFIMVFLYG